ncbi:MAG: hypothetical protein FWC47_11135 [Oscillospiraceae bacterium]|nr:hypothetical protein [Oscillospiraceae bacterium]
MNTNTSIKITGTPIKEPRAKKESIELLFKGTMSERVAKSLRSPLESLFIVNVPNAQWSKIRKNVKNDSIFFIQGDLTASETKSGNPCINVACMHILLREKNDEKIQAKVEAEIENQKEILVKRTKSQNLALFRENNQDKLIDLNLEDIILTEEEHTTNYRKRVILEGIFNEDNTLKLWCLIVRKLDDGKYSLVSGFKSYATCKVYDIKTTKAYVTNLNHKEFEKMIEGYKDELDKEEAEKRKMEEEEKEAERKRIEEEKLKEEEKKKEEEKQKKKEKYEKALKNRKSKK